MTIFPYFALLSFSLLSLFFLNTSLRVGYGSNTLFLNFCSLDVFPSLLSNNSSRTICLCFLFFTAILFSNLIYIGHISLNAYIIKVRFETFLCLFQEGLKFLALLGDFWLLLLVFGLSLPMGFLILVQLLEVLLLFSFLVLLLVTSFGGGGSLDSHFTTLSH